MTTNGSDFIPGGNGPAPTPAGNGIDRHIMGATIISFFFIVFLAVLLHVYARYLASREDPGGRERVAALLGVAAAAAAAGADTTAAEERDSVLAGSPGLDAATIAGLPAFVYDGGVAAECTVCLGAMEEGERARTLPNCDHVFHVGCIDTWLRVHSTCPLCRRNANPGSKEAIESTPPPPPAARGAEEGNRESESH